MRFHRQLLLTTTTLLYLAACGANSPAPQSVTVMTFNVENLFDTRDDPGKNDETFLPLTDKQAIEHIDACSEIPVENWRIDCLELDWNEAVLDAKLESLANTIRQVNDGRGADIIVFQEVENQSVLDRLRSEKLADLNYLPAILVEGADDRGIDVAFLSRFPLSGSPVLNKFSVPEFPDRQGDTRGILQATFSLPNGSSLTGFAVHFPAPFHPTPMRVAAYEHLTSLLNTLPLEHHAFAAGDFNTTSTEDEREGLLDTYARPHWTVAHDLGCQDCRGTYYYGRDDNWSFLDMILFAPARDGKSKASIRSDSVAVANLYPPQVSESGTPQRFHIEERSGVSDHWPLIATIEISN